MMWQRRPERCAQRLSTLLSVGGWLAVGGVVECLYFVWRICVLTAGDIVMVERVAAILLGAVDSLERWRAQFWVDGWSWNWRDVADRCCSPPQSVADRVFGIKQAPNRKRWWRRWRARARVELRLSENCLMLSLALSQNPIIDWCRYPSRDLSSAAVLPESYVVVDCDICV